MITQSEVREFFHYCPDTGVFERVKFISNQGVAYNRRSPVTSRHQHGYYIASFHGKRYRVHHLIFLYMLGSLPETPVDHINGNRIDNRWVNLRLVEKLDNQRNQGVRLDNRSGRTGVYWYQPLCKYQAQITVNGSRKHLGYFESFDLAVAARQTAEREYGFHLNHGGRPSWRT